MNYWCCSAEFGEHDATCPNRDSEHLEESPLPDEYSDDDADEPQYDPIDDLDTGEDWPYYPY